MLIEHTKYKLGLIVLWQWALGIGQSNNGSLWMVMELLAGGCVWGAIILARSPLYPIFILPVLLLINIKLERSVVSDKKGRIFGILTGTWQEFGISAAHFCLSYLSSLYLFFIPFCDVLFSFRFLSDLFLSLFVICFTVSSFIWSFILSLFVIYSYK